MGFKNSSRINGSELQRGKLHNDGTKEFKICALSKIASQKVNLNASLQSFSRSGESMSKSFIHRAHASATCDVCSVQLIPSLFVLHVQKIIFKRLNIKRDFSTDPL